MKLLDSKEFRQLRDVCIFEVNGIEIFMRNPSNNCLIISDIQNNNINFVLKICHV